MLNRFFSSIWIQMIAMCLVSTVFIAWVDRSINRIQANNTKPVVLVTGEDTSSKFIVERFEGVSISLVTDKLTGCEYVYTQSGGITPRMYSDGIQVCGPNTYPNGDHSTE
jgi:hypothetical protein